MGKKILTELFFYRLRKKEPLDKHGFTLAKKQCILVIRRLSFSQRTVNKWNILSADCVGANSVNV